LLHVDSHVHTVATCPWRDACTCACMAAREPEACTCARMDAWPGMCACARRVHGQPAGGTRMYMLLSTYGHVCAGSHVVLRSVRTCIRARSALLREDVATGCVGASSSRVSTGKRPCGRRSWSCGERACVSREQTLSWNYLLVGLGRRGTVVCWPVSLLFVSVPVDPRRPGSRVSHLACWHRASRYGLV